jgi:Uri superfamily endonuclease
MVRKRGAYILYLEVQRPLALNIGALGHRQFPAGHYAYIGSACGGIDRRIARHRRLAVSGNGKPHWHIDYLLLDPEVRLEEEKPLSKSSECAISRAIASRQGVTVPVPGFGATDCRAGCEAHLYRMTDRAHRK